MPSARSFYTQKTITTTTTRTKTVPQQQQPQPQLQQQTLWQQDFAPVPEPRSKAVSVHQVHRKFDDVRTDQSDKNVVFDTLAALVTDCNATAEILRSRSSSRTNLAEDGRESRLIYQLKEQEDYKPSKRIYEESYRSVSPVSDYSSRAQVPKEAEPEYKLRLSRQQVFQTEGPTEFPKQRYIVQETAPSLDKVCKDFDIETPQRRPVSRPRSETPISRKLIVLEEAKDEAAPTCAYCHQAIYGPCITALTPKSRRAQKYHHNHFMCNYCLKPLNLKGTYKEEDDKPYCHECFYRLFSGHIYQTENQISLDV